MVDKFVQAAEHFSGGQFNKSKFGLKAGQVPGWFTSSSSLWRPSAIYSRGYASNTKENWSKSYVQGLSFSMK